MNVIEALQAGREYLLEHGWIQGCYRHEEKVCALGAVAMATGTLFQPETQTGRLLFWDVHEERTTRAAFDYLSKASIALSQHESVSIYNDDENRTFNDIMALYDEAIIMAKEAEGGR